MLVLKALCNIDTVLFPLRVARDGITRHCVPRVFGSVSVHFRKTCV